MPKNNKNNKQEMDSVYVLKIVFYVILGSWWLRITLKTGTVIPIPLGALIGLLFISHDRFQIDRKIEYAVILVAMFIGFWLPFGLELSLR